MLSPLSVLQRCPCRRSECPEFGFSLFVCARLTSLPFFFFFCFCFPPPPLSPPACPGPAVPSNALSIVPVQSPAPSWPSLPQLGIATFFLPSGSPPSRCFSFSFFFFFSFPSLSAPTRPVPAVPPNALPIVPVQSCARSWPALPQLGIGFPAVLSSLRPVTTCVPLYLALCLLLMSSRSIRTSTPNSGCPTPVTVALSSLPSGECPSFLPPPLTPLSSCSPPGSSAFVSPSLAVPHVRSA